MLKRSDVRNACFRAKVGDWRESQKEIQSVILSKLPAYANWDNFTVEWDIVISKGNDIIIIKPEIDYDFILKVCSEASTRKKFNLPWEWEPREKNIIDIVESELLDGIMTWENFHSRWTIEIDRTLKRIHTKLLNVVIGQREIKEEEYVIKEQPKQEEPQFKVEVMTDEEVAEFKKIIKDSK